MNHFVIHQYPYLSDNYGVLIHCPDSGKTACIDCGEASKTIEALKLTGWTLTDIWITHHHYDHTDGLLELKAFSGASVTGPKPLSTPIDGIDITVGENDNFEFAGREIQVLQTPGHTKDMINFYIPSQSLLFAGDTLFTMGCGRLMECDAAVMFNSLEKLKSLPGNTIVYSSHEYALSNSAFALSIDPSNEALKKKARLVASLTSTGQATVPSTLKEELDTNPFLRCNDPNIRAKLQMESASDEEVFRAIRLLKDN